MAYIILKSVYANNVFYLPGSEFPLKLEDVDYKRLLALNCIEETKQPKPPVTLPKSNTPKEKTKVNNVTNGEDLNNVSN